MGSLGRRYAHVPLGLVSVLLIVFIIAWILERRVDGVWDPALRIAAPMPAAVTIAPAPAGAGVPPPAPEPPATAVAPPVAPGVPPPVLADPPVPPPPDERYVLESGPFTSAEAADRIEDQLNRLGFATVRFRKQEVRRLYLVAAVGFPSPREARRATSELGRGSVQETADGIEVLLDRVASLGEAVAMARAVRARGFEVRVDEDASPAVTYHLRYGQFANQAGADARSEELALFGLASRVVKLR
ncbi:MAG TPA: SPOR domain-containing protein [Methylomirabilota bacterium]|jgi:cell division protein FtsN|nr:SPOR domain-containing protein [Methylomirabilota bacterium]